MFGIIRPCRHRLGGDLGRAWQAHLCGMCLSLRDDHGQLSRFATNYDGLVISVLAEGQSPVAPARRTAGPCPLRGMRRASVAIGDCARLAATVSLILAAAKIRDHAADGDSVLARPGLRAAAGTLARDWEIRGARTAGQVGFDASVLTAAVGRQEAIEAAAGPGTPLLTITEPTETATGAAFAHTAVLAGRPGNAAALEEAGRLFGRIAHLIDAVEDLESDETAGAWNPLAATGTPVSQAQRLCEDAYTGIQPALADAEFTDRALTSALLDRELRHSIRRTFGPGALATACSPPAATARPGPGSAIGAMTRLVGLEAGMGVAAGLCAQDPGPGKPPPERDRCWKSCCDNCADSVDCCDCCECCGSCCDCGNCDCDCGC